MHYHPRLNEHGQKHPIHKPHAPSALETWEDAGAVATAVPDGAVPHALCGLAIDHAEAPRERAGWEALAGRDDFDEPEFVVPKGWKTTAGTVVIEPDGRVWLVSPTNGFAGYANTFPKGTVSGGLSLRATALKELYEEAGLLAELTGFLVDADRTNSRCRYYLARRIGGNPADMGWESQAVHLVPPSKLAGMASHAKDAPVVAALLRHLENWRGEGPERMSNIERNPGGDAMGLLQSLHNQGNDSLLRAENLGQLVRRFIREVCNAVADSGAGRISRELGIASVQASCGYFAGQLSGRIVGAHKPDGQWFPSGLAASLRRSAGCQGDDEAVIAEALAAIALEVFKVLRLEGEAKQQDAVDALVSRSIAALAGVAE